MPKIHETAIVHPGAELADDVEIQPFSIIEAEVVLGPGCIIGPHCVIGKGTVMGANNRTFSGAQIGIPPQDLKHLSDRAGKTMIGDGNTFRETVTVSSSTVYAGDTEEKSTRIGNNCLFMACVHIAHDCTVGNQVIMANNSALAGHVEIHDGAILGGLVGIHQFCRIGTMAFIGGMARVNMDALPFMITEGHPARCYGPNVVGLNRAGLSKDSVSLIRRMFKLLYRSGLNTSQAVQEIVQSIEDCHEKTVLLDFITGSGRGIVH
ncbi:MAG TPA: acyl-ACP--UDP-N-acetylglucosamine O-acyltransferase [Candidatus Hydrogenedentes bacterium]|jgi:UDP-N-acetylglucosamine acyltransferase|nr:MAG: Acyl-(acyl-carrier-protein)--UDP-N-acetylglucosamine O-acyltransferase [Candidatus Hydrogenedentes bacterium ADurb.Bin170]HOD96425.1 acyl-ACP--UDP-N-acetylglucosamine O-acyltransferase [Candidatus Hydrogenedentota bacterium]HOH42259.1 acyl-ACP--UDP-N-acetylglucosamine O-acyltransferase [Candidatus Hydrogenedentota bacterium]HOR51956.1 acyl-ACP--UDP-N-acetylglucosamine O-acyltransferase [Candidatus Hydrogenedentota bacterium]HPK25403.1 acyl-ACP--UDP-N-acetylglucosamine O-acyltransferase 